MQIRRGALTLFAAAGLAITACGANSTAGAPAVEGTVAATTAPTTTAPTSTAPAAAAATTAATTAPPVSVNPTPSAPPTSTPAKVPAALNFTMPTVGGGEFSGAAYAGKPLALWFWAPN